MNKQFISYSLVFLALQPALGMAMDGQQPNIPNWQPGQQNEALRRLVEGQPLQDLQRSGQAERQIIQGEIRLEGQALEQLLDALRRLAAEDAVQRAQDAIQQDAIQRELQDELRGLAFISLIEAALRRLMLI